jgi:hypothetical protein
MKFKLLSGIARASPIMLSIVTETRLDDGLVWYQSKRGSYCKELGSTYTTFVSSICWKIFFSGNLTQKVNKKVKALPASLQKLAFTDANRPNSFPPFVGNFKQGRFLRRFTCFWAHRTRPIQSA